MRKRQALKIARRRLLGCNRWSQVEVARAVRQHWVRNCVVPVLYSMSLLALCEEDASREPWSAEKYFTVFGVRKRTRDRVRRVLTSVGVDPQSCVGYSKCYLAMQWCAEMRLPRAKLVSSGRPIGKFSLSEM